LPFCVSPKFSVGTRIRIGKVKSYRRVVRRSVITPIHHPMRGFSIVSSRSPYLVDD
jgi:hypothetical protein